MPTPQSRLIWIILLLLGSFLGFLLLNAPQQQSAGRGGNGPTSVNTTFVTTAPLQIEIKALGTALAYDSAKIVSATSDYLVELHIAEGQAVKKGALIAKLNDLEEKARVAELTAMLTEQNRQLARLKNLTRTQATAQSMLDEQQAKVNATQAQLQAMAARLAEMVIYAPFDGVLGLRQVSNGAYLTAGTVLTTLDDIAKIRVEFNVAEHYLAQLQVGMPLTITNVAYPGSNFSGQIAAVDPRLDPVTRSVKVHGVIDNQTLQLRPGMLLNVEVELAASQAIQIPEKAVLPLQNKQFVFVVTPERTVNQVEIQIGERSPGWVQVLSGVAVGDEIVTEGTQKLRSGAAISTEGK